MIVFYIIALIPIVIGVVAFLRHDEVNLFEFLGSAAAAFALAALLHAVSIRSQIGDQETWSGQIVSALYEPPFKERYLEHHSEDIKDSKGNVTGTRTWTTTEYAWHDAEWSCRTNIDSSHRISAGLYAAICRGFADQQTVYMGDDRCTHFGGTIVSGDPNVYRSENRTGFIFPVTELRYFENRLKTNRTILTNMPTATQLASVFKYPENRDWTLSDRLLGSATKTVDRLEFDRLNARLGPIKRVNFILVGAGGKDRSFADLQQSAWRGGKKNDLVLVYGDDWAHCFGWTERDVLKRTLETIAVEHGVSTATLPLFEAEIKAQYELVRWSKFDYIAVEPTGAHLIWYGVLLILTQGGLWFWFLNNEHAK